MANLDVDFLFKNIQLGETTYVQIEDWYNSNKNPPETVIMVFVCETATKELFFAFYNKYDKLVGLTMGYQLGSAISNIFLHRFESRWF